MWGELVRRDGFHAVGGCWVEPDTNLPSGESLARQMIYGQRFFERELGRRCTELWLPDTFGYSGQLPQLMRLAGMTRMMTQKLSWNSFNPPEHHTLHWEGIDGSSVLVHFPPADTYNAEATVAEVQESVRRFRDHERSRDSLLVFGYGDGGGGPTRAMLERLRRMRDLRGMPRVELRTPEAFFDRVEATARDLRTVTGELYFEYHRGTYTTQAQIKRGNRRAEGALHDAECLAALASRLAGAAYPREELRGLWEVLLTCQFHDILPGTSITEVNERARSDLDHVVSEARGLAHAGARPRGGRGRRAVAGEHRAVPRRVECRRGAARGRCPPTAPAADHRGPVTTRAAGRRRGRAPQRAPARGDRPRRRRHQPRPPPHRPRGARRAREPARALRGRPGRLGRLGRRPVAPRDARRLPARGGVRGPVGDDAVRLRARGRRALDAAPARSASPPAPAGSRSTPTSTGARTTGC